MKFKRFAAVLAGALLALQCTPVSAEETVQTENIGAEEHIWGHEVDYDAFAPYRPFTELQEKISDYLKQHREIVWTDLGVKMDLENPENSKIDGHVRNEESLKAIGDYVVSLGYSKDILMIEVDPDFIAVPDIGIVYSGLTGDIDGNGAVELTDLTLLSLYLIGDCNFTEFQCLAADADGDSAVTLADLATVRQYISKQITSLRPEPEEMKSGPEEQESESVTCVGFSNLAYNYEIAVPDETVLIYQDENYKYYSSLEFADYCECVFSDFSRASVRTSLKCGLISIEELITEHTGYFRYAEDSEGNTVSIKDLIKPCPPIPDKGPAPDGDGSVS